MSLKEVSDKITADFESKKAEALRLREQYNNERQKAYEDYRTASSFGDRRENAMLDAAVEQMSIVNSKIIINEQRLKQMEQVGDISNYNSIGIVVVFSTVRISCGDEEFTYKIYPDELSYIDIGIIAEKSRLATALLGHSVGDMIGVDHSARNETLYYKIEEIY